MKTLFLTLLFVLTAVVTHAQSPEHTDLYQQLQLNNDTLITYDTQKDYANALRLIDKTIALVEERLVDSLLNKQILNEKKSILASCSYHKACYQALLKHKKPALASLKKAIDYGFEGYRTMLNDSSLQSLKKDKKYQALLAHIRPLDKLVILQASADYCQEDTSSLPKFTYQSKDYYALQQVRNYFKLDSVAGQGDELSRVINILRYVHNIMRHDGSNRALCEYDAIDIYNYHKATGRGVNCRHLAIALCEMYLAMGIPARYVTCMPKDEKATDPDCHVITTAYIASLNKWIWVDPTFNAYVQDELGNFLSIAEVRHRLKNNLPLVLNEDANWNNEEPQTKEDYLETYMAKNLYWFQAIVDSQFNPESSYRAMGHRYVSLIPQGFTNHVIKASTDVITCDESYFWQLPQ